MIWSVLVFLFILQLISFYFIALVFTKVSKFDDLEKKQRKLMLEMDDSIAAYLTELKDENERLIESISVAWEKEKSEVNEVGDSEKAKRSTSAALEEPIPSFHINTPKTPVNLALKSYANTVTQVEVPKLSMVEPTQEVDVRTRVLNLHDTGLDDEAIAKKLGIGRTEVELILKFR